MTTPQTILAGLFVVAALAAALFLLPAVEGDLLGSGVTAAQYPVVVRLDADHPLQRRGLDSLAYIAVRRTPGVIERGDTIGLLLATPRTNLRNYLRRAVERGTLDSIPAGLPRALAAELAEVQASPRAAGSVPAEGQLRSSRPLVRGLERDLLESELMGAEDGLRDFEQRLLDARGGRDANSSVAELEREIERRRSEVTRLERRLAARETVEVRDAKAVEVDRQGTLPLSQRDRTRILALAESLPPDPSAALLADIDGHFAPRCLATCEVALGDTVGHLLRNALGGEASRSSDTAGGYYLLPVGSPVLLATARRTDSLPTPRRALRVVVAEGT